MPKPTQAEVKTAMRTMATMMVQQHFTAAIGNIRTTIRALVTSMPSEYAAVQVEAFFDAFIATLEEAKVELAAEFTVPAELSDTDRQTGGPTS